jgi:hypothetical protein
MSVTSTEYGLLLAGIQNCRCEIRPKRKTRKKKKEEQKRNKKERKKKKKTDRLPPN